MKTSRLPDRNRVVLARDASAALRGTPCKDEQALWDTQEAAHAAAGSADAAWAAAQPLVDLCVTCPRIRQCAVWAELDHYSGIAAGLAWVDGVRRPVDLPLRQKRPAAVPDLPSQRAS